MVSVLPINSYEQCSGTDEFSTWQQFISLGKTHSSEYEKTASFPFYHFFSINSIHQLLSSGKLW